MKKVKKTALSLMMTAVITSSAFGMIAGATSKAQSFDNFSISALDYTKVGTPVAKENRTSVYAFITKAGNSADAQTWGCGNTNWAGNYTQNYDGSATSCVRLNIGTEYKIYNGIYEEGFKFAGLKLKSRNAINSDRITGRWSPDSVNTGGLVVARHS